MLIWFALALAHPPVAPTPLCGPDNPDACPADFGHWSHLSWIPDNALDTVRPAEIPLGSGIGLDIAFRHTLGRWDVPVAILDSGIDWEERRLYRSVLLNTGELPLPQDANGAAFPTYDADDNGVIDLDDWAVDPRIAIAGGSDGADDRLDPSDLLAAFSDGVDRDGNGYIDDIAGWDFYDNDNDPYSALDNEFGSHGTGMMKDAVGAPGDGSGIGTCPNCSLIPVRVGDTFIVDGDRVALAIAYAVDRGAKALGMSVGAVSHPEGVRDAIQYAADHDVVIAAVAGDENSFHPNAPAAEGGVLYVHSIAPDTRSTSAGAYSFFNTTNCNNYGPRMDFVVSSSACASGAASQAAGAAALLFSAGLDAGTPLTADEVRSLMRSTVDDVALTEAERAESRAYPSKPGWDAFHGHGRLDIGTAVAAVMADELPPTVALLSPDWFAWPASDTVAVEGRVASDAGATWTLEVGRGAEPATWHTAATGDGPVDGHMGSVDLSAYAAVPFDDLADENVVDRMARAHAPLVTIRLTATDTDGATASTRRAVWVQPDDDLLPGFPVHFDSSLEPSQILADLDGDGILEIIVATSGGSVHAVDGGGVSLPGFPVRTDRIATDHADAPALRDGALTPHEGIIATPAVGDVDGDGRPDIVAATLAGSVVAWGPDGQRLPGFPVHIEGRPPEEYAAGAAYDRGIAGAPTLADIDGDGALEIIVPGMDQRLYVWRGTGEAYTGYPIELCVGPCGFRIIASAAVGDIDGDGDLDAAVGTNEVPRGAAGVAWVIDLRSATPLDGWPVFRDGLINQTVLPVFGEGHPSPISLVDLDGDGTLELASNPMLGSLEILDATGAEFIDIPHVADRYGEDSNVDDGALFAFATHPAFGDMDLDGVPDLVLGGGTPNFLASLAANRWVEFQHAVGAWSGATGDFLPGWPRQTDDVSFLHAPAIADITGDGRPEAIHGSGGFLVYAWNSDGDLAPGWPKHVGGWAIGSPTVGDIDGDGMLDVVIGTRQGWLFAWRTSGRADQDVQWAANHHDAQNTGNFHTPLPVQSGPVGDEGCGCRTTGAPPIALWLLLLLGVPRRR